MPAWLDTPATGLVICFAFYGCLAWFYRLVFKTTYKEAVWAVLFLNWLVGITCITLVMFSWIFWRLFL